MRTSATFDFRALFRQTPAPYIVLLPDLTIVEASDEYRRATLLWNASIRGCGMFDVFPDNPHDRAADGTSNLRKSLYEALATGSVQRMPLQKYDVPDRVGGEGWVEKYWLPVNRPVFGKGSREITHVIHHVTDVTEAVCLREWAEEELRVTAELRTTLRGIERDLARRGKRLQQARRRLRRLAKGDINPRRLPASLKAGLAAPETRPYLPPGTEVLRKDRYRAFHRNTDCWLEPPIVELGPGVLPTCPVCRKDVLYQLIPRLHG